MQMQPISETYVFTNCKTKIWEGFTMNTLMLNMIAFVAGVKERFTSEKGATAVEYGIMVALIAVVIIAAVTLLGHQVNDAFTSITSKLPAHP